jgi:hypothetical protein
MEFSAAFFFTAQLYNSSIMITAAKGSIPHRKASLAHLSLHSSPKTLANHGCSGKTYEWVNEWVNVL